MKHTKPQAGFTLVEMIVSMGVFAVVVTIAVGALLIMITSNQQLQAEQSVMTNLSFAVDSMTRELRTGTHYYCRALPNRNAGAPPIFRDTYDLDSLDTASLQTRDCPDGRVGANQRVQGVAFIEGGDSITGSSGNRILYFYDDDQHILYRKVGAEAAQSIVSDGIYIVNAEFFVAGTGSLGGSTETTQPSVTIQIEAKDDVDDDKSYFLQTTVTQRTLDI